MNIKLTNLGKRYNREWIFRNLNFEFDINKQYAITGPNGSGKSTLLQIIAGSAMYNEGAIVYRQEHSTIEHEKIFQKIAYSAPYLDLVEEMTLLEFLHFHHKMKGWISPLDTNQIIALSGLGTSAHKQLRYFSSGMKQRVKLAQAIFSNVPVVLLDEPATNLDEEGMRLYKDLVENYCMQRLVIISSNDKEEYAFCGESINMLNYK
ncbi:MAG: ATP-binding cassette domain-containing protein [Ginsengibacter sp.]